MATYRGGRQVQIYDQVWYHQAGRLVPGFVVDLDEGRDRVLIHTVEHAPEQPAVRVGTAAAASWIAVDELEPPDIHLRPFKEPPAPRNPEAPGSEVHTLRPLAYNRETYPAGTSLHLLDWNALSYSVPRYEEMLGELRSRGARLAVFPDGTTRFVWAGDYRPGPQVALE